MGAVLEGSGGGLDDLGRFGKIVLLDDFRSLEWLLVVGPKTTWLGGALKISFHNGGGKNYIKLTKSGQGKILRPEIERSDRPEARQNSGFGWRGHKKLKQIIYY